MIPADTDGAPAGQPGASGGLMWRRFVPLAVVVLVAAVIFAFGLQRYLLLETLVGHRAALVAFVDAHFVAALAAFVATYVVSIALSIPGALLLTIAGGILFGWLLGGLAVLVGATAGATIIFLIAKTAFGQYFVDRAGPRLTRIMEGFRADAFSYLLFLRIVPLFPFVLVNLAPALMGVPLSTFVVATALGIIPGTFVFAAVGAGLDSVIHAQEAAYRACLDAGRADCRLDFDPGAVVTPQLIGALTALGLLALVPVVIKRVYVRRPPADPAA
jgi:uncharacterized membrane protein YdjX (TVP38/TMEM64 family)